MMRKVIFAALAAGIASTAGAARAEETDTEHIFGFTEGTDIGEKGEKEGEFGVFGRLGKAGGRYVGLTQSSELKMTLTDNFRVAPGVFFSNYNIRNVPSLPNYNGGGLDGVSFEMKYRVLEREKAGFGMTLAMASAYSRIDPGGGGDVVIADHTTGDVGRLNRTGDAAHCGQPVGGQQEVAGLRNREATEGNGNAR